MNNRELAERIGIAERTFYKYIKNAIDSGIVDRTSDGYVMNSKFFPIKEAELTDEEVVVLTNLVNCESRKQSRQAK